jgi:hypothetical protein
MKTLEICTKSIISESYSNQSPYFIKEVCLLLQVLTLLSSTSSYARERIIQSASYYFALFGVLSQDNKLIKDGDGGETTQRDTDRQLTSKNIKVKIIGSSFTSMPNESSLITTFQWIRKPPPIIYIKHLMELMMNLTVSSDIRKTFFVPSGISSTGDGVMFVVLVLTSPQLCADVDLLRMAFRTLINLADGDEACAVLITVSIDTIICGHVSKLMQLQWKERQKEINEIKKNLKELKNTKLAEIRDKERKLLFSNKYKERIKERVKGKCDEKDSCKNVENIKMTEFPITARIDEINEVVHLALRALSPLIGYVSKKREDIKEKCMVSEMNKYREIIKGLSTCLYVPLKYALHLSSSISSSSSSFPSLPIPKSIGHLSYQCPFPSTYYTIHVFALFLISTLVVSSPSSYLVPCIVACCLVLIQFVIGNCDQQKEKSNDMNNLKKSSETISKKMDVVE